MQCILSTTINGKLDKPTFSKDTIQIALVYPRCVAKNIDEHVKCIGMYFKTIDQKIYNVYCSFPFRVWGV